MTMRWIRTNVPAPAGEPRMLRPSARCASTLHSGAGYAKPLQAAHPDTGEDHRRSPAGRKYLSTSDPDLSAEDVALGYKNLLEATRGFRDLNEVHR